MGKTQIISAAHPEAVMLASETLRQGRLVAIPTETVYGLAGWVKEPRAIEGIFEMKKRPARDPLIVHIFDATWISRFAELTSFQNSIVAVLAERFWPGPLTFILRSRPEVNLAIRAGGSSIGLRSPAHDFFRQVLWELGDGIAAPSANIFGHISPTKAEHVFEEMNGQDLLIVDGGPCTVGIESTILEVDDSGRLRILRPGVVTEESISTALKMGGLVPEWNSSSVSGPVVPGQDIRHYAPNKDCFALHICDDIRAETELADFLSPQDCVLIDYGSALKNQSPEIPESFLKYLNPTSRDDLQGFTQSFFECLRSAEQIEKAKAIVIYFPEDKDDLWSSAIRNRIARASSGRTLNWDVRTNQFLK